MNQKKKMSENHALSSKGDVPFSWEQKPGIRKATVPVFHVHHTKLPPPPRAAAHDGCRSSPLRYHRGLQIPPPPCTAPPVPRNSSRKGVIGKRDDPFLIAYMECTKNVGPKGDNFMWFSKDDGVRKRKKKKKKNVGFFSCKDSCGVLEDKIVRASQLPVSRSQRADE
ncbi:unnamed protein product [Cuscuta europaea]|uniref:Uncharacterized protein n=1 Tax=Cuscuta europaea TaxID=41803 RepID=A0A9P0ZEN2_CUSEU|nr:unnamed protein product [Cuscuta europaea]